MLTLFDRGYCKNGWANYYKNTTREAGLPPDHDHYGHYTCMSLLSVYPAFIGQCIPNGDVTDILDMTGYFDSSFSGAAGRCLGAGSPSAPTAPSRDYFSAGLHWQSFTQLL